MKTFFLNFTKFFALLLLIILIICEIKISNKTIIRLTKNTGYEKIAWNLTYIDNFNFEDKSVFIGPSLVEASINDSILCALNLSAVNLGVNHPGSDLEFYFYSKVIKKGKPKNIILYRPKMGVKSMHPLSALFYSPSEYFRLFSLNAGINFFIEFLPKRFYFALKHWYLNFIENVVPNNLLNYNFTKFGFRPRKKSVFTKAQKIEMINEEIKRRKVFKFSGFNEFGFTRPTSIVKFPIYIFNYLVNGSGENLRERLIYDCKLRKINILELYIPTYPDALLNNTSNFIFNPPYVNRTIKNPLNFNYLNGDEFWNDKSHLSMIGADLFSIKIVSYLE
jgi:hypothetical protein